MNQPKRILLVEDNTYDADLVVRALRKRNLADNIVRAKDGQEALDFFFGPNAEEDACATVKVVFLDLKMPKISGLEVVQQLKSNEKTRWIPVVMLTSSQENRDILESYKCGANSYVVKPMQYEDFARIIGDIGTYWIEQNYLPQRAAQSCKEE